MEELSQWAQLESSQSQSIFTIIAIVVALPINAIGTAKINWQQKFLTKVAVAF